MNVTNEEIKSTTSNGDKRDVVPFPNPTIKHKGDRTLTNVAPDFVERI